MIWSRPAALVLLLVLLTPGSSADMEFQGEFTGPSLDIIGGTVAMSLEAFLHTSEHADGADADVGQSFIGTADRIRVESYQKTNQFDVLTLVNNYDLARGIEGLEAATGMELYDESSLDETYHRTPPTSFGPSRIVGGDRDFNQLMAILPIEGSASPTARIQDLEASLSSAPIFEGDGKMNTAFQRFDPEGRIPQIPSVDSKVILTTGQVLPTLVIDGSFWMILFDWKISVHSDGAGRHDFEAGQSATYCVCTPKTNEPNTGTTIDSVTAAQYEATETILVIRVDRGHLEIPWYSSSVTQAVASQVDIEGAERLLLKEAKGSFVGSAGPVPVDAAQELHVEGAVAGHIVPDGRKGLQAVLRGTLDDVRADGISLQASLVAPDAGGAGLPWWIWTVGIVPLALLMRWGRMRQVRSWVARAEERLQKGDDRGALRLARRISLKGPFAADAATVRIEAMLGLGHVNEARVFHQGLAPWPGPSQIIQVYLGAQVAGACGDRTAARTLLDEALQEAPELARLAVESKHLRDLVRPHERAGTSGPGVVGAGYM